MTSRLARLFLVVVLAAAGLATGVLTSAAGASPRVTTLTMQAQHGYTPQAPTGATDDYHCTLVDPRVKANSFIVSSQFYPNSVEVHHAILFLVPPNVAAAARAADGGGKGWTCFGETALPGTGLASLGETPWLTAWAPGHGADVLPAGTGVKLPAGSLVIMQIHYNLLRGDKPVRAKLTLHTVPASTPLKPLSLTLMPAPPDIPCPAGVTGPLCNRSASLADLSQRFGADAAGFDYTLEDICGRNPMNPPTGDTTACSWGVRGGQKIVRVGVHMHLLGRGMKIVLDPGTPQAKTLVNVTNYDFNYQRSYTLKHPVLTHRGDTIGVTCTYDPTLRQELPQLRKLPPRFVTWGDGSSDEMCLGLVQTVSATGPASYNAPGGSTV
jgi:Copper type II ascorbate-dependent monooxygenase, C-terminal domain